MGSEKGSKGIEMLLLRASINHLFTDTYKRDNRTVDPKVEGSDPFGVVT